MKNIRFLIVVLLLSFHSCNPHEKENYLEKWKGELLEAEREFAEMASKDGISEAFTAFAAEDAVLLRNNLLIIGKNSLKENFKHQIPGNVSLTWKPDFVDVSRCGDLGYTYGRYVYTITDSMGNAKVQEGIFHTVWKRQDDGTWKFVWD